MDQEIRRQLEEKHFIEDIGLFFEQMGMPRIAGRMLGFLLISDPEAQSITNITQALKASKSSISVMARFLVENGLIERVASPMPRRDYYRFKSGGWILYMRQWLGLMSELHEIAERGLALTEGKPDPLRERLLEAHDLFSLMEERMPALLETLEKERGERHLE
ncbi:MAG: MarR family transcriptional regulator [Chloroflexota bacterium]|nr:MAG: MarR family transcriptional regulator [Chloroflexota bacterium]